MHGPLVVDTETSPFGQVAPARVQLAKGARGTFTATPSPGLKIDGLYGCGGAQEGEGYRVGPVADNCTVRANFRAIDASTGEVQVSRDRLQVMIGLEANAAIGEDEGECDLEAMVGYRDELARRAVAQLGLDRLRLEVRAGLENPVDHPAKARRGELDYGALKKQHWYRPVNDNDDPGDLDPNGFQFSDLDLKIEMVVAPVQRAMAAEGRAPYIALNYVNFAREPGLHHEAPDEYAEFMLASVQHIERKYGWVPDGIEVLLEPDIRDLWPPARYAKLVKALRARMQAAGYDFEYIGPSVTDMSNAVPYFDTVIDIAGPGSLDELSFHRYRNVRPAHYGAIRDRIMRHGIRSGMTEMMKQTHLDMETDLQRGLVSTWTQLGLSYCGPPSGGDYFHVDDSDPKAVKIFVTDNTRYLAQYHRTVYRNAVRYQVRSDRHTAFAFQNPDGRWTVVVRTEDAESFSIGGLPQGRYGVFYTTDKVLTKASDDLTTDAHGLLHATIPAAGVLTAHQR